MRLFGADPEELRTTLRKLHETEVQLAETRRELQMTKEWMASKDSASEALRQENREFKEASLKLKEENLRLRTSSERADPFADYPPELKAIIDFQRMGIKEPW